MQPASATANRITASLGPSDLIALGAMLLAFWIAQGTVTGIDWPGEIDFYRDMSAAQSILEGDWLGDPAYRGETRWYNPLVPALFAAIAGLTSLPVHKVIATCGPILNLGGPLFFCVSSTLLLGRWGGLFALLGYLFLGDLGQPSWLGATYSPWPWPMNVSQGLFYLTIALYVRSLCDSRPRATVAAGLALGLTALGHTAPAAIAALLVTLHGALAFGRALARGESAREHLLRVALIGGVSFVVALPFLYPIYRAYGFHIVNKIPGELAIIWGRTALLGILSLRGIAAIAGLAAAAYAVRKCGYEKAQREVILIEILLSIGALFAYSLAIQRLNSHYSLSLPQLVPSFHFHLYLKAAESMLFGYAVATAAGSLPELGGHRIREMALSVAAIAVVGVRLPPYMSRIDLVKFREEAQKLGSDLDRISLHEWIGTRTAPEDVFLAQETLSVYVVSAAGRKVVALDGGFSNPYVSFEERAVDRENMLGALESGDAEALAPLIAKYGVRYAILEGLAPKEDLGLVKVFRTGRHDVYRFPDREER